MYWFINCSLLSDGPVIQFLTSISSFSLSNYRKMQTLRKTKVSWHFWKHTTLKARCSFPGTTCSRHTRNTLQQVKMYLPSERQGRFTARIFFSSSLNVFQLKELDSTGFLPLLCSPSFIFLLQKNSNTSYILLKLASRL